MTIYALSSGPGISGLAVVRVSGSQSKVIMDSIIEGDIKPRVATLKKIRKINSREVIDEGIILWFPGPKSYTGDDMLEFHVHGSRAVIDALLNEISKIEKCRVAEPGEFTKKRFSKWQNKLARSRKYR